VSKRTLFALLVVLLVVLAPYTVLPALLESVVAGAFQNQLGLEQTPEVEIESSPAPLMYAGSFSKALISVRGLELAGVKTEKAVMELDPFDVNILESVTGGMLSTAQPLSGTLHLYLSEDSALRLAQGRTPVPVQDIQLEENEVVLTLALGFGSVVSVRGRPLLQNGTVIFQPQKVEAAPAGVTPAQVLALTTFSYPVGGLPYGAKVSGLQVRKDHVILSGRLENIPLEGPTS
jgi:LmeA-like phospholipid-binding